MYCGCKFITFSSNGKGTKPKFLIIIYLPLPHHRKCASHSSSSILHPSLFILHSSFNTSHCVRRVTDGYEQWIRAAPPQSLIFLSFVKCQFFFIHFHQPFFAFIPSSRSIKTMELWHHDAISMLSQCNNLAFTMQYLCFHALKA